MKAVAGVFASGDDAEHAAREVASLSLSKDRINLLFPGQSMKELQAIPIS